MENIIPDLRIDSHLSRRVFLFFVLTAICAAGIGVKAIAQGNDLTAVMKVWKIVVQDGKEAHAPADNVSPGDILAYQVEYKNTTSKPLRNIQAQLPIPKEMEYIPGSANPQKVQASVDGKKFASVPLRRRAIVNGKSQIVAVPYSEYRYLRWNIVSIDANKTVTVSARAKLQK